jgi:threonine dehydratase
MTQLADIALARYRLARFLQPTRLEAAPQLGAAVWLKLENTNTTHSFKIRGAFNALLNLTDEGRKRGVIAASSGNHAQGIAYAARKLGIQAQIVMPKSTPNRKVEGVERYGGRPILFGETYDGVEAEGRRRERDDGLTWVSPYNDPHVIAGAGTIGLEILDDLPETARVIVPVSGGGLIAGVATAIKGLRPDIEVIGVNAVASPAMYNLFHETRLPQNYDTLAEALSGEIEPGSITMDIARRTVDAMVLVDEVMIADAMRFMAREHGCVAEGGGAVGVAALLHGVIPVDDRPTVVVVSGGNVDMETLLRVLNG